MFTGIVTDVGEVRSVKPRASDLHRITIYCRYPRAELIEGSSIACSGVCLTVVEAGDGILVRHAAGEAQRVDDRFLIRRVVPEARAAERRAERGVVDGDDAAVAGRLVVAQDDLFVA